jgi:hypothetical protein
VLNDLRSIKIGMKVPILKALITLFLLYFSVFGSFVYAENENPATAAPQGVAQNIESLKNEVIELNRDLFILEEDLLFSANTQVSVFVSLDADEFFQLDSVQLKLDDKIVSNYLYTEREIKALKRGGVQRLYIGNLTSGEHEITAFFTGQGPAGRDYKRGTTKTIEKSDYAKYIELKIVGNSSKEQPDFEVKVWE